MYIDTLDTGIFDREVSQFTIYPYLMYSVTVPNSTIVECTINPDFIDHDLLPSGDFSNKTDASKQILLERKCPLNCKVALMYANVRRRKKQKPEDHKVLKRSPDTESQECRSFTML